MKLRAFDGQMRRNLGSGDTLLQPEGDQVYVTARHREAKLPLHVWIAIGKNSKIKKKENYFTGRRRPDKGASALPAPA
jgi:hypothetical protein